MITFLTNIPTPYRTAFFDTAADIARESGMGVHVLYCAKTEAHRSWPFIPDTMHHPFTVLPGWSPRVRGITFHANPSAPRRVRALDTQLLICAGAWNTPTVMWTLFNRPTRDLPILFWSEGHQDAVNHSVGPIAILRRRVMSRFDGFVVPNASSAAWSVAQTGHEKPTIRLPNLIEEEAFTITDMAREDARTAARSRLRDAGMDIGQTDRILLQVGRLEARKGVLELADAFAARRDRGGARLVFVGSGTLEGALRQRAVAADGCIVVAGEADMDTVRQYLRAADVFVLNTLQDPNPLTPIEASFSGLPLVVSARAGNVGEIIRLGQTGALIADPSQPHEGLDWALQSSNAAIRDAGAAALANVMQSFSRRTASAAFIRDVMAFISDRTAP